MSVSRDKSSQDIADLFDVEVRTIQNWVKEGCPCDPAPGKRKSHKFNEAEVAAWMKAQNKTGKPGRPAPPSSAEMEALNIRKLAALVAKYERENKVADGKLIDAAQEQQRDIQKITLVRNRLCGLGATLAPQFEGLDGAERQSLIDSAIEEILREFGS